MLPVYVLPTDIKESISLISVETPYSRGKYQTKQNNLGLDF